MNCKQKSADKTITLFRYGLFIIIYKIIVPNRTCVGTELAFCVRTRTLYNSEFVTVKFLGGGGGHSIETK